MITVVVGSTNGAALASWRAVLDGQAGLTVQEVDAAAFRLQGNLDALVISGLLARDRLGTSVTRGKSEIIEPDVPVGQARFVVASPVMPAHLEWEGGVGRAVAHDRFITETEAFVRYNEVFRAVEEYNASHSTSPILVLGIHLDMIGAADSSDPHAEATDFLRAFRLRLSPS